MSAVWLKTWGMRLAAGLMSAHCIAILLGRFTDAETITLEELQKQRETVEPS